CKTERLPQFRPDGRPPGVPPGGAGGSTPLAFTADGKSLASADQKALKVLIDSFEPNKHLPQLETFYKKSDQKDHDKNDKGDNSRMSGLEAPKENAQQRTEPKPGEPAPNAPPPPAQIATPRKVIRSADTA